MSGSEYNYMLLSRLQMDCEYFLNAGARNAKYLWALNEKEQIAKMKELHNGFTEKPEWLSFDQILKYEEAMVGNVA